MFFLVQYDRHRGALTSIAEYGEWQRDQANEDRLAAEIDNLAAGRALEIVVLEASSRASLEQTHSRYFKALQELGIRQGLS